jgi:hypothetical protein
VYYVANAGLYSFETDTSSEFAALSFVARLPGSFPGSGYFGDLVVRRVTFTVERNTDGVNELLMTQLPLLQTNVTGQLAEPIVLARQVNLFALEFWDSRANEWVGEWLQTNQLPKLVRFALAFGQDAPTATRRRDVTMRVVSLASSAVQPDWQLPRAVPGGPAGPGTPGGGPGRGRGGPGTVTGPPPNAAAGFFDSGGRLGVFQGISGPGGRR